MHLTEHPETAVTCHGKCRAGATCPALCELPDVPAALAAGQSGSLMTWRIDRFGNRITSAAQEVPFLATGSGPGTLRSQIIEKGDGSLEIRYKSAVLFHIILGIEYRLSLVSASLGGWLTCVRPVQKQGLLGPASLPPCSLCVATLF